MGALGTMQRADTLKTKAFGRNLQSDRCILRCRHEIRKRERTFWETSNANSIGAQTRPDWTNIRHDLPKLNPPFGCSRLHAHSKSTCTDSGSICAWFKKT